MKEAGETWPNKGRGADGRGQRHPATYTSQLNAQGFLNYPQTIKTSRWYSCAARSRMDCSG